MTPTNELRFVEREILDRYGKPVLVKILQQKWVEVRDFDVNWSTPPDFEWRDVPCVKEDGNV